jgi:ELWxxDGT repeat protein
MRHHIRTIHRPTAAGAVIAIATAVAGLSAAPAVSAAPDPIRSPIDSRTAVHPPQLIKDLTPGPAGTTFGSEFVFVPQGAGDDGLSFFTAAPGAGADLELWATSRTAASTVRVADINVGPEGSNPSHLTSYHGRVYFFADDGSSGRELWSSDGTSGGTQLVKDLNPGPGDGVDPLDDTTGPLIGLGGGFVFAAQDAPGNLEPWLSDGTADGTAELTELHAVAGSRPEEFHVISVLGGGGGVVFSAETAQLGREPWFSDGTANGTRVVADVQPGPGSSDPHGFAPSGGAGTFLFAAQATPGDTEVHRAMSPTGPVALVRDVRPGPTGSDPREISAFGIGRWFFLADDAAGAPQVWSTDGTDAGTSQVSTFGVDAEPRDLTTAYSFPGFIFSANGDGAGREPWAVGLVRVGSPETFLRRLRDVEPGPSGSDPRQFLPYVGPPGEPDAEVFVADTSAGGSELWSDAPSPGPLTDLAPGPADGVIDILTSSSSPYLVGDNGTTGPELYWMNLDPQHVVDPTSLRATAPRRVAHRTAVRQQIRVQVTIGTPPIAGSSFAYGPITLHSAGRIVGRGIAKRGTATVRIKQTLRAGKHRVFARYAGNSYFLPSRSAPVTIRVLPPGVAAAQRPNAEATGPTPTE